MIFVLSFLSIILLFIIIYNLLTLIFTLPDASLLTTYKRQVKKVKRENVVTRLIESKIKIKESKRNRLILDLQRAGIDSSPEFYMGSIITIIIIGTLMAIIIFLLLSKIMAVGAIFITISLYQQKYSVLLKRRKERIQDIETELPFFVRYFFSQIRHTKDVIKIFKSYIDQQSKTPLTEDLQLTLSQMLSSSIKENMMERAIENSIERSDVEKQREFYRGILGVLRGEDQSTFFLMLDRDMKELAIRNVEREGEKLPKKAKKSTWIIVGIFCICLFSGFVQMIVTAVNNL